MGGKLDKALKEKALTISGGGKKNGKGKGAMRVGELVGGDQVKMGGKGEESDDGSEKIGGGGGRGGGGQSDGESNGEEETTGGVASETEEAAVTLEVSLCFNLLSRSRRTAAHEARSDLSSRRVVPLSSPLSSASRLRSTQRRTLSTRSYLTRSNFKSSSLRLLRQPTFHLPLFFLQHSIPHLVLRERSASLAHNSPTPGFNLNHPLFDHHPILLFKFSNGRSVFFVIPSEP